VLGQLYTQEGIIDEPIGEHPVKKGLMTVVRKGKPSITAYRLLESFPLYSWLEFVLTVFPPDKVHEAPWTPDRLRSFIW
jgi:23S rRNA-/tRNA-specific pseudouridylate synthase